MSDVVRWVLTRDRPTAKASGDVAGLVDVQLTSNDRLRRQWAAVALQGLQGVWNNDERTMSGICITAHRMLTRWLPGVASTCSGLGMLLVTIWQSKAQIDAAYGILADSVLTNHGTKIFFSGVRTSPRSSTPAVWWPRRSCRLRPPSC